MEQINRLSLFLVADFLEAVSWLWASGDGLRGGNLRSRSMLLESSCPLDSWRVVLDEIAMEFCSACDNEST